MGVRDGLMGWSLLGPEEPAADFSGCGFSASHFPSPAGIEGSCLSVALRVAVFISSRGRGGTTCSSCHSYWLLPSQGQTVLNLWDRTVSSAELVLSAPTAGAARAGLEPAQLALGSPALVVVPAEPPGGHLTLLSLTERRAQDRSL